MTNKKVINGNLFQIIRRVKKIHLPKIKTFLRYKHQQRKYDSPAPPFKLIKIDPSKIEHMTGELNVNDGLGQIKGGDWDLKKDNIKENNTYTGLKQRYEDGLSWKETDYKNAKNRYKKGDSVLGYETYEEFLNIRCAYVDKLYQSMKSEGYRLNKIENHDVPEIEGRDNSFKHSLEPLVVITRSGDIVLRSGVHRVTIASILGLDHIPVHVLGRHSSWQGLREKVYRKKVVPDEYKQHPDLEEIDHV